MNAPTKPSLKIVEQNSVGYATKNGGNNETAVRFRGCLVIEAELFGDDTAVLLTHGPHSFEVKLEHLLASLRRIQSARAAARGVK
jgi:hypothetical protein